MLSTSPSILSAVQACFAEISQCASRAGRLAEEVTLLAVSKTRTVADIEAAYAAGCRQFGESYVQEALVKMDALSALPLQWHFIGPIQSNKTQAIARRFDWVHSVDREKIAQRLNEQRPADLPPLNVCIQVNISGESSKSGTSVEQIPVLARVIRQLPRLRLRGLMAIPQQSELADEGQQRAPFKRMHEQLQLLKQAGYQLDTLSMGMSDDLCAAIMEGATIVRVGTGIFGTRD